MTTPDLTAYHAVHAAIRTAPHRMAVAAGRLDPADRRATSALVRYWKGYTGEVLAHHTGEDEIFFPALVDRVAPAADLVARTDAEHHRLDELTEAVEAAVGEVRDGADPALTGLAERMGALAVLMDDHLAFEDAEILPLFERHFDGEEFDALEQQVVRALGIGAQAAFTVPFLAAAVTPDVRAHLLAGAPVPFRVLYRATRRSHARLATRALGPVVREEVAA